ncbi:hypothetical protein LTR28_002457, partial [Elasticomyces elasticus]
MLKKAVDNHRVSNPPPKPLSQALLPDSSPLQSAAKKTTVQSLSAGYNNVLRPSGPSTLNGSNSGRLERETTHGLKRTHSGLAKALTNRNAFDEAQPKERLSQKAPVLIDENPPVKSGMSRVTPSQFFNEDDFDSDIDLDVEDPATKGSVAYPSLPTAPGPTAKSVRYPTLPNQQTANTEPRRPSPDSGYGSVPFAANGPPVGSSVSIPWSSSPAEHFQPPAQASEIRRFAYTGPQNGILQGTHAAPAAQSHPTKRRTIPWLETAAQARNNDSVRLGNSTSIDGTGSNRFTPLPRDTRKANYPWNTTASAIKEQQKALREANKKLVKSNKGTEESLDSAKGRKGRKSLAKVFLSDEQQH